MVKRLSQVFNIVLLGLASGVVPLAKQSVPSTSLLSEGDFQSYEYNLGDYSSVLLRSLVGEEVLLEGNSTLWRCSLLFGNPSENFSEWIHGVELSCKRENEEFLFPLGEGEFRRGYTRGRVLLRGEAAETLARILVQNADDESVESPMSERTIAWGPTRSLRILTLRSSAVSANLRASLECYKDVESNSLHSCAISY